MINGVGKKKCTGCFACYSVCPRKCIEMVADVEGFLYPEVDDTRCVHCGMCKQVCVAQCRTMEKQKSSIYAAANKNEFERNAGSSGGIFSILAKYILGIGGVVFGAAYIDGTVKHVCISKIDDLNILYGSKYVQSYIGNAYQIAKSLLESGKTVLFTGTPCQIDGLRNYLRKDYQNLFTQDLICHGVPSQKVFDVYLDYKVHEIGLPSQSVSKVSFRDKTFGWKRFSIKFEDESDTVYLNTSGKDEFFQAFLNDISLRESCYRCPSRSVHRNSDITLADFWGGERFIPELADDGGISLVFIHSEKGAHLFEKIKAEAYCYSVDVKSALALNPAAYRSPVKPWKRRYFFRNLDKDKFSDLVRKSVRMTIFDLMYLKIVTGVKKILIEPIRRSNKL